MYYTMKFLMKVGEINEYKDLLQSITDDIYEDITIGVHRKRYTFMMAVGTNSIKEFKTLDELVKTLKEML